MIGVHLRPTCMETNIASKNPLFSVKESCQESSSRNSTLTRCWWRTSIVTSIFTQNVQILTRSESADRTPRHFRQKCTKPHVDESSSHLTLFIRAILTSGIVMHVLNSGCKKAHTCIVCPRSNKIMYRLLHEKSNPELRRAPPAYGDTLISRPCSVAKPT